MTRPSISTIFEVYVLLGLATLAILTARKVPERMEEAVIVVGGVSLALIAVGLARARHPAGRTRVQGYVNASGACVGIIFVAIGCGIVAGGYLHEPLREFRTVGVMWVLVWSSIIVAGVCTSRFLRTKRGSHDGEDVT